MIVTTACCRAIAIVEADALTFVLIYSHEFPAGTYKEDSDDHA